MAGVRVPGLFLIALVATLLVAKAAWADSPPAGNETFRVLVEDIRGRDGLGVFGAVTGPEHPLGPDIDVLQSENGTDAFSSYITIRSYTTGTDYVQTRDGPASGNIVVGLEQFGQVQVVAGGYEASYQVPANDALDITTGIVAEGAADRAMIRIYGSVTNRNPHPVDLGARALLDLSLGGDDGPTVTVAGQTVTSEADVPLSGLLRVSGGGQALSVNPAGADSAALVHWNRAFESAFDFESSGLDVTSAGGLNDSALLVYFGADESSAVRLPPEETFAFAVVVGTASTEICDNETDDDGDELVDLADPDCAESSTPTSASTPTDSPTPSIEPGSATLTTATPQSGGPSALPGTGGPFGMGNSAWLVLAGAGGTLVATGAIFVARRRQSG